MFFSYKDANNGHIGVRLANGQFWSDGNTYASIAAYNAAGHTPVYVGWSTQVDGVAVMNLNQGDNDMVDRNGAIDLLVLATLNPHPSEQAIASIINQPYPDVVRALITTPEHVAIVNKVNSPTDVNRQSVLDYTNKNLQ